MAHSTCICCPIYRPGRVPHHPGNPPVCDSCRRRPYRDLFAIARLHHDLAAPAPIETDDRLVEIVDEHGTPTGEYRWRDPAAALLPVGAIPARSGQPLVSGTREPSTPVNLDVIDLTAPARVATVHDPYRDQTGHVSAATLLHSWSHALRVALFPHERAPAATVPALVSWLTSGMPTSRLDTACTRYPAIADFVSETRQLCQALRAAAGETEPPPQIILGVPCKGCNRVSQLERREQYIECDNCQLLLTEDEYRAWVTTKARSVATS